MKSGKMGLVMAALATVMLTASLALARPGGGPAGGPGGPGHGPCGGGAGFAQLSPEKQAAYQKLAEAYYNKTAQTRAAVGVKRAELNAVAVAQNPDTAKIESLSKEIGDLTGKLIAERTQFRIQVAKEIGVFPMGGGRGYGHGGFMGGPGAMGGGCQ
ncbi:MAG: periplasmic heavy metal sensor [Desulfovibrionaceae bacterium]